MEVEFNIVPMVFCNPTWRRLGEVTAMLDCERPPEQSWVELSGFGLRKPKKFNTRNSLRLIKAGT